MNDDAGWRLRAVMRHGAARFREASAALPVRAWRTWLATLAAVYAGVIAGMVALVAAGRAIADAGHLAWEHAFLLALEDRVPLSFSSAVWLQTLGTDIMLAIFVLIGAGLAVWFYRPIHALTIVIAYVALDLVVRFGWMLWDRARPAVILDGIAAPGFASFPSGHTAKSIAVYGTLAFLWARSTSSRGERLLAFSLAAALVLLVMLGRLRMGVHWPSDIVGGAAIGTAWLIGLAYALHRAEATTGRGDGER